MSFAENLKKLIDSRADLSSPSDFAKKAGLSRQAVNAMVRGKVERPNALSLEKIISYFDCSVEDVIESRESRVAKTLHQLMLIKGVNIYKLSKKTGVDRSLISKILNNKVSMPTDKTLTAFSLYFNVSISHFKTSDSR